MATQKALVLKSYDIPISLETIPKPVAGAGEIVVRVLCSYVVPYARDVFTGKRPLPFVFPAVPGASSIARVESIGPDTTSLTPGQLVFVDFFIRARDDRDESILLGFFAGMTAKSRKLMEGVWRNGTLAEFTKVPLENVFPLDEQKLLKEQGYTISELPLINYYAVAYGGLRDVGVEAGDTVIVAPASGKFSGAAVVVALAMGAKVVAAGRNEQKLQVFVDKFGSNKVKVVKLVGDVEKDTEALKSAAGPKGADVCIDFCPPAAGQNNGPSHIKAGINALRNYGKLSLMGGILGDISIPYFTVMLKNIKIQGKMMYERGDMLKLIKLVENGDLVLGAKAGVEVSGEYGLEQIEEAMTEAAEQPGWGYATAIRQYE